MIYTGYYGNLKKYKEFGIEPVAISGKVPDFYEGFCYPDFAPRYSFFRKWKDGEIDNKGYEKGYREWLNSLNKDDIEFDFKEYNTLEHDCILLCYEKPESFCHRHILAEWLKEEFGFGVEEFQA